MKANTSNNTPCNTPGRCVFVSPSPPQYSLPSAGILRVLHTYGTGWQSLNHTHKQVQAHPIPISWQFSSIPTVFISPIFILFQNINVFYILYVIILFDIEIDIKIRFVFFVETVFFM